MTLRESPRRLGLVRARAVTEVHLVFPGRLRRPCRPSGGNTYDRQISAGLAELGWTVVVHEVSDAWPAPGPATAEAVDRVLAHIPVDRLVVSTGCSAPCGRDRAASGTQRDSGCVALVHMPDPPGGPPDAVLRAVAARRHHQSLDRPNLDRATRTPDRQGDRGASRCAIRRAGDGHGDRECPALRGRGRPAQGARPPRSLRSPGCRTGPGRVRASAPSTASRGSSDSSDAVLTDHEIADRVQFTGPLTGADLDRRVREPLTCSCCRRGSRATAWSSPRRSHVVCR